MVKNSNLFTFNVSCTGTSHLREGKPCQDYSACLNSDQMAIAAVADGHGGKIYFRSDRGARFAVETAIECIEELITIKNTSIPKPIVSLKTLKKSIIAAWHKKIENDVRLDPINGDTTLPYGTTLLAAAITGHYWFVIQIGDGKCVVIKKDGSISQPVPLDESCFLNLTTSLCDEEADITFRYFYSETMPYAIFLGSDGLENSFPINKNEEYLSFTYKSIYDNFMKEGFQNGESQLREMLPLLTQKGSGDDISIAGIIRIDKVKL